MISLSLQIAGDRTAFAPGERVEGTASWVLDEPVRSLEVRLFWYTERGGSQEVGVVVTEPIDAPDLQGSRSFVFTLPQKPLSYAGKLFDIRWALEFLAQPSGETSSAQIVVSPTGRPLEPLSRGEGDGDAPS